MYASGVWSWGNLLLGGHDAVTSNLSDATGAVVAPVIVAGATVGLVLVGFAVDTFLATSVPPYVHGSA